MKGAYLRCVAKRRFNRVAGFIRHDLMSTDGSKEAVRIASLVYGGALACTLNLIWRARSITLFDQLNERKHNIVFVKITHFMKYKL